ncbi:MAG: hypothetical protein GQE15_37200, partial [Archangiaceae bacterium]|nr:hypothetical protein [Archangiaceae bacterium]
MNLDALRAMSKAQLGELLRTGHAIDPRSLDGWAYRGTVLATPRIVERLTWQTFQKCFHRLPDGRLVGWNVRLVQRGLSVPSEPQTRAGAPRCVWPFEVVASDGPELVIDYAPFNTDTMRFVKDPLVSLSAGDADLLLGVSDAIVGPLRVRTPTWFVLEREHRVSFVPPLFQARPLLRAFERRWADALFDALLGTAVADRARFWELLSAHGPAMLEPGLRAAVHALTFLPVTLPGFRKPFFALDADTRLA